MSDLYAHATAGDLAGVLRTLAEGAEVDAPNEWGETPLVAAAGVGARAVVEALLDASADVRRSNDFGFDALKSALWVGAMELATLLAARGAEIDLDAAAALGRIDAVRAAIPLPLADPADAISPWLWACRCGQVEVLGLLHDAGMPVDLHPPGEQWGGIGAPGLHHAAEHGHVAAIDALLTRGADLSLVDDVHGSSALGWAASAGQDAACARLLAAGADRAHANVHGLTAADLAERGGFPGLAARLR